MAKPWAVDRQIAISDNHGVKAVLIGKEIEGENLVVVSPHGIDKARQWNSHKANELFSCTLGLVPNLKDESESLQFFNCIRVNNDRLLTPVLEFRLTLTIDNLGFKRLETWETFVLDIKISL